MKILKSNSWPLVRFIAPAYPEDNIFSRSKISPLGLVSVATAANKMDGLRVEIIDENNYRGPCDENGLPDHEKLQKENPASVVGVYCGLTCTMNRVYELSKFYHARGVINIAGGWHAHYCPEEALNNNFDIVVHGDGENAIQQILNVFQNDGEIADIPGISFWENNKQITNSPLMIELPDLSVWPYPDFGLIRYPKKINVYPISHIRGCQMNCEFCSVKGEPRWVDPQHVFNVVSWLVDTRKAKKFFIVDDRLEGNNKSIGRFFELIADKYGSRLKFTVQIRLETAKDIEFLEKMKRAGVRTVCIGYESPIKEDLEAMNKGYSVGHMVEWTKILRRYFWVHGMFIFGYPNKQKSALSAKVMAKRYRKFISDAKVSSVQLLKPVPLVGTELRARLEREDRIFSLDVLPWYKYDGNYVCFMPDNMSKKELQEFPIDLMKWFYNSGSFLRIPLRTVVFPVHYLIKGWQHWYYGWKNNVVKYGAHLLIKRWQRRQDTEAFLAKLESSKTKTK